MASKFFGTFEVTADFVNDVVKDETVVLEGDWLLVGFYHWLDGGRSSVCVYDIEDTRRGALDFLRLSIRYDYAYAFNYDYELWHVVAKPDWMPYTLNCIELLDHSEGDSFDETLVWCDIEEIPGNGVAVLRTDWGYYVPTDCQSAFPRTLDDLCSLATSDYVEYDADIDDYAWVPTAEIDAFCDACEGLVSHNDGLDWRDVQRLRISGDALHRMVSA